jgi:hypothetical protein
MKTTVEINRPFEGHEQRTVVRVWIIVKEPGRIPEKKDPPQTNAGVVQFLKELVERRPKGTEYVVANLTWNGDLWVESGNEVLGQYTCERCDIVVPGGPCQTAKEAKNCQTAKAAGVKPKLRLIYT